MPYLHCSHCRLTIYRTSAPAGPAERCPRCDAPLSLRPGRLFGRGSVPGEARSAPKTPAGPSACAEVGTGVRHAALPAEEPSWRWRPARARSLARRAARAQAADVLRAE